MHELNQRWRSVSALGLLLVIVTVFYAAVIQPLWRLYQQNSARIMLLHEQIGRFQGIASNLKPLEQKLEELTQSRELSSYTLQGESATLAAASLQNRLKLIMERYDADLISTRIMPFQQEGALQRVTVSVSLRVTSDILQKVLYDLESGVPFIIIDNVLVQAPQPEIHQNQANGAGTLIVQLDLTGFAKPARLD